MRKASDIKTLYSFFKNKNQFLEKSSDPVWNEFVQNYVAETLLSPYEICLNLFDEKELIKSYQNTTEKKEFVEEWSSRIREDTKDEDDPEATEMLVEKWKELCDILF